MESIAVSFLWSFVNDAHEQRVGELLAERAPGVRVTLSSEIAPVLGEYERTATTAVNAYVAPKVVGYLDDLERRLREEGLRDPLLVMQASGGLTSVEDAARRPILTLDSGPTGGILGCQYLGRLYGEENVICTDVGGTSFDVGLILRGEVPTDPEPVVSQYVMRIPKVSVQSIGAGGGSLAWLDEGGLLRVGPQSAGSRPGPACYGQGGTEPTVTDADLVLGYLNPAAFLGGRMELRRDLALEALAKLGGPLGMEPEEVAIGVFRIINAHMGDLIRKSTIEQGHDPRECVLVAYGGAGPTHAAFYGHDIGSKAILVLADSTAFSAEGMLTCDITHTEQASHQLTTPLAAEDLAAMTGHFSTLESRVLDQFAREGVPGEDVALARTLGVRYRLQVHTLDVDVDPGALDERTPELLRARFAERYRHLYGEGALLSGGALEFELHSVVGTRALEPRPVRRARAGRRRRLRGADRRARGVLRARGLPLHARSTTATRCARATGSPARRSCSGWATASSSRPTTRRSSTATSRCGSRRPRRRPVPPSTPAWRWSDDPGSRDLRGHPPPPLGDQRRPGDDRGAAVRLARRLRGARLQRRAA